jgi:anti-sigma regulatory factor (Ser/Thr protein kinase)
VGDRKRHVATLFENGQALQAGEVAEKLGITRQTAHRHLRRLVDEGQLIVEGAGRSTRYRSTAPRDERRFPTAGLEEDRVWNEMSGPSSVMAAVSDRPRAILQYVFTEIVNNAIDHSGATEVEVLVSQPGTAVAVEVIDRGVGIFRHIRDKLGLETELEALQELSKGKTTTMPSRHSGEGVFFSSKASDWFEISSGTLRWVVDNRRGDMAVGALDPRVTGTEVRFEVDTDADRDLNQVFAEYTEDFEFSKTRAVIRLFAIGTDFVSRSQAKRLVHGLEAFREVVFDFNGVNLVGQGFADEVFRVWAKEHPEVQLIPTDMNDAVAFMIERAIRHESASG